MGGGRKGKERRAAIRKMGILTGLVSSSQHGDSKSEGIGKN
jgi:hypothetical protein